MKLFKTLILICLIGHQSVNAEDMEENEDNLWNEDCLLYTSPSTRDATLER